MLKRLFRLMAPLLCAAVCVVSLSACGGEDTSAYRAKADLLAAEVLSETTIWEVGIDPADDTGYAVFLSVCDAQERAEVFSGSGDTLEEAWKSADKAAESALKKNGRVPAWVKADVVYIAADVTYAELCAELASARPGSVHYGVAFDGGFKTALLEAELNSADIFQYGENAGIDLNKLNEYLKDAGRKKLKALPEQCTVFQCFAWLCDEESNVCMMDSDGLDYGRRTVETMDASYAQELILSASDYLVGQIKEDGSFIYGYDSRNGQQLNDYNILRHAGAVWSLICRYQTEPDEVLAEAIQQSIDYLLAQVVYSDENTAYLYDESTDEIKLGGCGLAVVALTEYMDVFETNEYQDVCCALGNGILTLLDKENGTYYHVLNRDFSKKEELRTVYYDGEATFALCRLYGITQEQVWLDAAKAAVDHFIEADYTKYCDSWVAYTMNEITKYVTDDTSYYAFALRNVQKNIQEIYAYEETGYTYLELLMASFEMYDRLLQRGASVDGFDMEQFLKTIYARADRMLNGFFYPEYAMYMQAPGQIVGSFMVRQDGFRVRIDDIQHNICGYCLYAEHYDKLVEYGMLEYRA